VRIRENMSYASRAGKMLASLRAIAAAAVNPPEFTAEIRSENGVETRRVAGIAISNNPLGSGRVPFADRLDGAVLGVYVASPLSTWALVKLASDVFRGTWRASPMVSEEEMAEVTLHFPHRKRGAQAVIDGELIRLDRLVTLKVHPQGLKVMLPKVAAAQPMALKE
jgi:diacylglycerol kinase family enzyme